MRARLVKLVNCVVLGAGLGFSGIGLAADRVPEAQHPIRIPEEVWSGRLALFKDAIDAVGAVGDALQKLTDGLTHVAKAGVAGWDYVSAQRTRNRLLEFSARTTTLVVSKQRAVVINIEKYLSGPQGPAEWSELQNGISNVDHELQQLIVDMKRERSEFVTDKAYLQLTKSMANRAGALSLMQELPKPETPAEKKALAVLGEKYARLLDNAEVAVAALNAYLIRTKDTSAAGQ